MLGLVLFTGGLWLDLAEPSSPTVKVASVIVPHERDYFATIIDIGTPEDVAHEYQEEFAALNDQLFVESQRAADFGAQIIFWSEVNGWLYPEDMEAFLARSQQFARENRVYFSPAYMVLRYGDITSDNMLAMITSEGKIAYTYTKTMSWYPTDSDGIIHSVETPYGTLSSAICFDMDFPGFINQAARQNVDIMLDPALDWESIKPYHTYVGLFRAVENGFSIVRSVNMGTSIAVDYTGSVLAYQDYFDTTDPVMIVDVPTEGVWTLYGTLGDWFAYVNIAFLAGLLGWVIIGEIVKGKKQRDRILARDMINSNGRDSVGVHNRGGDKHTPRPDGIDCTHRCRWETETVDGWDSAC